MPIDPNHPQPRTIGRAVASLEEGGLVAYPTDTSYGLGCDLHNKRAIEKLYQVKGHDRRRPMTFLVPDLSEVARYALVSNFAYRVLRHLTPGPFTFVLEATKLVPEQMQTRQRTVGLRLPSAEVPVALAHQLARPLVTTTAGEVEGEALIGADEIAERFGHGLALILDGGPLHGEPSTVLSLLGDRVELLRQGKGDASGVL